MSLKLITAPAVEPVTLAEAKTHLRVDGTDDDALITALITAARQDCEHRLGRALIDQIWEKVLDAFPEAIELPRPPVSSIVSVTYYDTAGALQTLDAADYSLDGENDFGPAWLTPVYDTDWPDTYAIPNAVRVRCTCGYGASGSAVPEAIKAWIKLRVGALYAQRESIVLGQPISEAPRDFFDGLLDRYRIVSIA